LKVGSNLHDSGSFNLQVRSTAGVCARTLVFSLYVAPIADVIKSFGIKHAQYADDTQLYIALDGTSSLLTMNDCVDAVHRWFTLNGLSLNPDKSEAIVVGTAARQRRAGEISTITLGENSIAFSKAVRTVTILTAHCRLTIMSPTSAGHHSATFVHFAASESYLLLPTLNLLPLQ
jgi:Reverse transcriptase (RNA-dependent DNA polymerase)